MSKKKPDPIVDRLNILIKITMASVFKDKKKDEIIRILSDWGISRSEVADLVGTTVKYVDKVKYEAKKKKEKSKSRSKRKKKVEQK